ncbi:hypothetical protein BAE44_0017726 [Dichanthelium oligosanthes]|uniref:Rapid alkalinization factor n=1 Tax=Dichanthelium oligosanthes TaxID=888268 RepID=A0A1E5V7V3_9POAL|nr:hypothetical protein BAE44_0017726 [Dichanthelium oligosanthes]
MPLPSRAALAVAVALLLVVSAARAAGQTMATMVDRDSRAPDQGAACAGTVEECDMASGGGGAARRELWNNNGYISYDAMSRGRPRSRAALAVVAAVVLLLVAANPQRCAAAAHGHGDGAMACSTGTVGECVDDGAVARRELGGNGYIGYGAMGAGNVPCSYRGASYYNCRPSGAANPYSRGCSAITQCRG